MGLFVNEDGHVRGWLAALLCCWAAMGDDETYGEKTTKGIWSFDVDYGS